MFLAKGSRFRAFPLRACLLLLAAFSVRASAQAPKKVDKPCDNGVVQNGHAYSKCVDGFWQVVSEVEYSCPDGSRQLVVTTEKTEQKCTEPFDLRRHLEGPCQAPVPAGEHVVRKCVQGFWEEETYSQYRCLDGTLRIIGGPIRSVRTTKPCGETTEQHAQTHEHHAPPPEPKKTEGDGKAKSGTEQSPPAKMPPTPAPPTAPPPPPKTTPPPPPPPPPTATSPSSNTSTYMCNKKSSCDCAKQTPKLECKAGSGCPCTKG